MNGIQEESACDSIPAKLAIWIQSARRGDRQALGHALSNCRDYLLLVATDRLNPELRTKGNPSDLVQETFLQAQRGFASFRGCTAGEWRLWLRTILVNKLTEESRRYGGTAKRQIRKEIPIHDHIRIECARTGDSPSTHVARGEREAALLAALERLPDRYRNVVISHHRDQKSFEEIGESIGKSPEAVRKIWKRALVHLRKELGPTHDPR